MSSEAIERFDCFGGSCVVIVSGDGPAGSAAEAAALARRQLEGWHLQFSRFLPGSELSRINRDGRETVAVSPLMARLAGSVIRAGNISGGLVDGTLGAEIERAGYEGELGEPLDLRRALALAPVRRPAGPREQPGFARLRLVDRGRSLRRDAGVMIDSGGLAKGMFADVLGELLDGHESYAVICAGDLLLGGTAGLERPVEVQSPFDGSMLHRFSEARAGIATSGIGRRSWIGPGGLPAHHLLDPATGRPAFTGIVQATALAPSALDAEVHAKAALLAGPGGARRHLPHGGFLVFDDGSVELVPAPVVLRVARDQAGRLRVAPEARRAA